MFLNVKKKNNIIKCNIKFQKNNATKLKSKLFILIYLIILTINISGIKYVF